MSSRDYDARETQTDRQTTLSGPGAREGPTDQQKLDSQTSKQTDRQTNKQREQLVEEGTQVLVPSTSSPRSSSSTVRPETQRSQGQQGGLPSSSSSASTASGQQTGREGRETSNNKQDDKHYTKTVTTDAPAPDASRQASS